MFNKKKLKSYEEAYDLDKYIPIIKASICTGEQVIGFKEKATNKFIEISLIKDYKDIEEFRKKYNVNCEIKKEY